MILALPLSLCLLPTITAWAGPVDSSSALCDGILAKLHERLYEGRLPPVFQALRLVKDAGRTGTDHSAAVRALFPSLVAPGRGEPIAYVSQSFSTTKQAFEAEIARLQNRLQAEKSLPESEAQELRKELARYQTLAAIPDRFPIGYRMGGEKLAFLVLDLQNYLEFQQLGLNQNMVDQLVAGKRPPLEQVMPNPKSFQPVKAAERGLEFTYEQYETRRGLPSQVIESMRSSDHSSGLRQIYAVAADSGVFDQPPSGVVHGILRAVFAEAETERLPLEQKNSFQLPRQPDEVLVELGRFSVTRAAVLKPLLQERLVADMIHAIRRSMASSPAKKITLYLNADRIGAELYKKKYGCRQFKGPTDIGGRDEYVLTTTLEELEAKLKRAD